MKTLYIVLFESSAKSISPFRAMQHLAIQHFVWCDMNRDVRNWSRACSECQRVKIHHHTVRSFGTFSSPDVRFDHVHIDFVCPLPPSGSNTYLLTCVDHFISWPEAIPIPDTAAETVDKVFVAKWVAMFGASSAITTDRGWQFGSTLFKPLTEILTFRSDN